MQTVFLFSKHCFRSGLRTKVCSSRTERLCKTESGGTASRRVKTGAGRAWKLCEKYGIKGRGTEEGKNSISSFRSIFQQKEAV